MNTTSSRSGPYWHLQLLQLLFRYIEAGGIPSILFHYIALLFSYLLIPPALLITILFHVCQQSRVSFRVEEAGFEKLKSQILGYKKIDFLNDGTRDVQNANRLRLKLPKSP